MDKSLIISEIHGGSCRCENQITGAFVKNILSYKEKRKVYDRDLGYSILKDVNFDFGRSQYGKYYFPSGLLGFIKRKAKHVRNQDIEVMPCEHYQLDRKLQPNLPGIKLEPYQSKMLRKVGPHKRGILVGPTGMGKSIILGGIIDKLGQPNTLIIVPTKNIAKQLYKSFTQWFGNRVGLIGDSVYDQRDITICLFQSLNKYTVARSNLKLILQDEAHLINNTIIDFLSKYCKNIHYRYSVTATPHRFKGNFKKTFQMMGCFGDILCEVTDTETSKRVLPVKAHMVSFYCHSPKGDSYNSILREDILLSKIRNTKLLKAADHLALKNGKTVLVLVDETRQAERIEKIALSMGLDPHIVHGKMDGSIIESIKNKLDERKINLCIATKVFSVGTDIPNVDCVVLASARKSEIDTLQKIGRGRRRVGTIPYLILIDSIDKVRGNKKYHQYFYGYSLERMNIYKEKEWELRRMIF